MEIDVISAIFGAILTIIGSIVHLVWNFYKYKIMRMGEYALQIKLIPTVYQVNELRLVDVMIWIKNIGKGAAFIKCPSREGENQNPILSVRMVPAERDSVILWNDLQPLFPPIEFLKDFYFPHPEKPYIIEPGVVLTEHVLFTTTYDGILLLEVRFWDIRGHVNWERKMLDLKKVTSHPSM